MRFVLHTPKIEYFTTLVQAHCVETSELLSPEGKKISKHTLQLPGIGPKVYLFREESKHFYKYSFEPNTPEVIDRCYQLNVEVLCFHHLLEWDPGSYTVYIMGTGAEGAIIEVHIAELHIKLHYGLDIESGNVKFLNSPQQLIPVSNCGGTLGTLFVNMQYFRCFYNEYTLNLSHQDIKSLAPRMSSSDERIFNNIWRYSTMTKSFDRPSSVLPAGQFASDDIISFALYLGISEDVIQPFGMISAIKIYREDAELFKPCFSLSEHTYTAIGNEKLKSRLLVDENKFVAILQGNPTSKTSCNVLFCLSLRLEGHGLYFDAEDFKGFDRDMQF